MRVSASTAAKLDQVSAQLRNATENLGVVETQYATRADPSNELVLERRFSDGEIQYLLQDWPTASVLFYDLLADKAFDRNPRRPDALWYLSDALYQQQSYGSARLYLRELLRQDTPRNREALSRYLDVTSKLNDWGNLEPYLAKARGPDGQLPPDIQYVYAKWLSRRSDLPPEERRRRAAEAFQPLTAQGTRFRLPSLYFLAVLRVQAQDYAGAMERFAEVNAAKPNDDREQRIVELSHLGLARLLVETGTCPRPSTSTRPSARSRPTSPRRSTRWPGPRSGPRTGWARERDRHPAPRGAGLAARSRGADPPGAPAPEAQALHRGHRHLQRCHQHLRAGARRDRPDARRPEGSGRLLRQPPRPEREARWTSTRSCPRWR
jgi:hypothetical protein